jgi:hypothetical protein
VERPIPKKAFRRKQRETLFLIEHLFWEEELAEKVRDAICEEWHRAGSSLHSTVIYERLLAEEVEVADYQMSAILSAFVVGRLITLTHRRGREEETRKHGDVLISGVSPDLCRWPPARCSPKSSSGRRGSSSSVSSTHFDDNPYIGCSDTHMGEDHPTSDRHHEDAGDEHCHKANPEEPGEHGYLGKAYPHASDDERDHSP